MTMKEVLRSDLSAPGREVVQTYIVIPPGAASGGKHTHPGEEIAFVIEGSLRVEVDGESPVVKNAGESIIVPAGRVHFAANAGSGAVRAVSTYIVEKGKPRTTIIQ
jgi:quercetin dioxygenase-like cupin family protein